MNERPHLRVRVNGPMAAIVIAIVVCSFGTWLALVLTGRIEVSSIYPLLRMVGSFVSGAVLPGVFSWWRERRVMFEVKSDPPTEGG